jgi:alcohol-forming fatty acyl-CoA reductase
LLGIDVKAQLIPVDFVVNLIIAAAWKNALDSNKKCAFYNCNDSSSNQTTWGKLCLHVVKVCHRFVPYKKMVRYPRMFLTGNHYVYAVMFFLTQFIPAVLLDVCLKLTGRKTL